MRPPGFPAWRPQKTGHLQSVSFLDKFKDREGVLYARPLVQPGSKTVCVKDGMPTWLCELMVIRPNVKVRQPGPVTGSRA